jgi:MFS family permease
MKKKTYQNVIALLFALTWGLVLLDRNAITFLFPVLMKAFDLNNAQTGQIVMVTGFGFVLSSLFITPLADRSGLKRIWLVNEMGGCP